MTMSGSMSVHLGHAIAGGLALVLAVVALVVQRARARRPGAEPVRRAAAPASSAGWLAVAMLGTATIHGAVIREHFEESALLGTFFLVLTALQFAYVAAVLARPSRILLQLGVVANVGVVVLWVYTRTFGIPFGVAGGEVEAVALPDLLSAAFEVAAVAVAVAMLRGRSAVSAGAGWRVAPSQQLAAVLAVALTSAVVASTGVS
jgi:hypothetical protein